MTPTATTARAVAACSALGFLVSWAFFAWWFGEQGWTPAAFVEFWRVALTTNQPGTGLTWDLVFSGLIVTCLLAQRARALGPARAAAVVLATWSLGVCVGLGLLVWWLPREG